MKPSNRNPIDISQAKAAPHNKGAKQSDRANTTPEAGRRKPGAAEAASQKSAQQSDRANTAPDPGPRNPDPGPTNSSPSARTKPNPLTEVQKTVVRLIDSGQSVTSAMTQVRMARRTFYVWRKENSRFRRAVRNAREDYRGLVLDGIEDLQIASAQFLHACIQSETLPVPHRIRAVNSFLRNALTGAFVLASFPGDDPNDDFLDDDFLDDEQDDRSQPETSPDPIHDSPATARESSYEPNPVPGPNASYSEQKIDLASTARKAAPTAENHVTIATAPASPCAPTASQPTPSEITPLTHHATLHAEAGNSAESVQSVQSQFPPNPPKIPQCGPDGDQSDLILQRAPVALSQTWLSATFLHKHESRDSFQKGM